MDKSLEAYKERIMRKHEAFMIQLDGSEKRIDKLRKEVQAERESISIDIETCKMYLKKQGDLKVVPIAEIKHYKASTPAILDDTWVDTIKLDKPKVYIKNVCIWQVKFDYVTNLNNCVSQVKVYEADLKEDLRSVKNVNGFYIRYNDTDGLYVTPLKPN